MQNTDTTGLPEEMLLGQFIPLHYHFNMLQDVGRMAPFRDAINLLVAPGARVLELGGGTGVLSYFAAQRASKVWCVERNPALANAARRFLQLNPGGDIVEVIQADAMDYLPPTPVDLVICEMLHTALVREKQLQVIQSFKDRYRREYGPKLPLFIPDAAVLSAQLIEQDFCFSGYTAPVPMFLTASSSNESRSLSDPVAYATICYDTDIPHRFDWCECVTVHTSGTLNAVSFFTKNFLAYVLDEHRAIEWLMHKLVLPLPVPLAVSEGDRIILSLSYEAGCSLESLQSSLNVCAEVRPQLRAAA